MACEFKTQITRVGTINVFYNITVKKLLGLFSLKVADVIISHL